MRMREVHNGCRRCEMRRASKGTSLKRIVPALLLAVLVGLASTSTGQILPYVGESTGAKVQPAWAFTRFMSVPRAYHTATMLPTGKVLVAGGVSDNNMTLASAELYDPVTALWSPTGAMTSPRGGHVAIPLANGKVLALGGGITFAEVYDPASGTWSAVRQPTGPYRYAFSATLLQSGKVLVAGGRDGNSEMIFASAEVYDPVADMWTPAGSLTTPRYGHSAAMLANGKLLIVGGFDGFGDDFFGPSPIASAEVFDPVANAWSVTQSALQTLAGDTETTLADGTVLVAGGGSGFLSDPTSGSEIYDASGTWRSTSPLFPGRYGHTATVMPDGRVFAIAGIGSASYTQGGGTQIRVQVLSSTTLYDPATGTWTSAPSLNVARGYHTTTLLPGGNVLVTGGVNVLGGGRFLTYLASAEIYQATPLVAETAFVVTAVFSDQAGLYQLIQLQELNGRNGQNHLAGTSFTVTSKSGVTKQFVFPYDLPSSDTAYRSILIKTESFVLPDGWTDFVVRDGFLPTDGGTIAAEAADGWTVTFSALPADGHSLYRFYPNNSLQPTTLAQGFSGPAFYISIGTDPVIEYYNPSLDHYFMTASQPDIDALDSARTPGWRRTGFTFQSWISRYVDPLRPAGQNPPAGLVDVCRIYLPPADGNSHFFSASASECAASLAQHPEYVSETSSAFLATLPDPVTGACPPGQTPVYRLWNGRADSNHRYTTSLDIRNAMLAMGYKAEGYGPDNVSLCAGGGV
jgi:N-acetylneuraminic acid mutarotase